MQRCRASKTSRLLAKYAIAPAEIEQRNTIAEPRVANLGDKDGMVAGRM
jgi:hypothetical protein